MADSFSGQFMSLPNASRPQQSPKSCLKSPTALLSPSSSSSSSSSSSLLAMSPPLVGRPSMTSFNIYTSSNNGNTLSSNNNRSSSNNTNCSVIVRGARTNSSSSDRDDLEWQTVKIHLKKNGLNDELIEAMDRECPSFEVLQALIGFVDSQKQHEKALTTDLADVKRQLETARQEAREAALLDVHHDAMMKRLKQAIADCEAQKARADRLEASLKQERDDRCRVAAELGNRDFEIMELKSKIQQLQEEAASAAQQQQTNKITPNDGALATINKNLAANQVTLKKELFNKEKEVKQLQEKLDEMKKEVDVAKADSQLKAANARITELQDQCRQWKANLDEVRHSAVIQMESMKREHDKALQDVIQRFGGNQATATTTPIPPSSLSLLASQPNHSSHLTCYDSPDSSEAALANGVDKVKKLEEISRLQSQVAAKFQEQNHALREELNAKKAEIAALQEQRLRLEQRVEELRMSCNAQLKLKMEACDAILAGNNPYIRDNGFLPAIQQQQQDKTEEFDSTEISSRHYYQQQQQQLAPLESDYLLKQPINRSSEYGICAEAMTGEMCGEEDITMMMSAGSASGDDLNFQNEMLRRKLSERTGRLFEVQKELGECQSAYSSICKQLRDAKKELDDKEEYIITLRRRLRWSQSENHRLLNGGILAGVGNSSNNSTNNLESVSNSGAMDDSDDASMTGPPSKTSRRPFISSHHNKPHQQRSYYGNNNNNSNPHRSFGKNFQPNSSGSNRYRNNQTDERL